ncbi:MAG: acyl-CoA dehydrogenase family protein [Planctomycetota bacterium]
MIRFSDEHQAIRDMVADFADHELSPNAEHVDQSGRSAEDQLARLGALGLLGAALPEAYGGTGGDLLMQIIILEELARGCAGTAVAVASHACASLAIAAHGSAEQKARWLPELASGRRAAAWAHLEKLATPGVLTARAERDAESDAILLHGRKRLVAAARRADVFVVVVGTGASTGEPELFIVERAHAAGLTVAEDADLLGLRGGELADVNLAAVRVDASARLGSGPLTPAQLARVGATASVALAALANGLSRTAIVYARGYAAQRRAFGVTIDRFEALRLKFGAAVATAEAARLLTYRAAAVLDRNEPAIAEAAQAKYFASETAYQIAKDAVQILGGNGFSREYPVERMYRDAKMLEVMGGVNHAQRLIVADTWIGATT